MDDAGRCGAPSPRIGRLASSTFLLLALGCGHVRNAVHAVTPTAPPAAGSACPAVPWRCTEGVPERCAVSDGVARWYPVTPLSTAGRPAACAVRCVVDATAHCAGEVTQ
jgi:hypothetical protein